MNNNLKTISIAFAVIAFSMLAVWFIFWRVPAKPDFSPGFSMDDVKLPQIYDQPLTIELAGQKISIAPINAASAKAITEDNVVKYIDAFANTDIVQTKYTDRIKEDIILKQPGHPAIFEYQINLTVYDFDKDSQGNLIFYQKGHKGDDSFWRFAIPAPFLIDANGKQSSTKDVYFELTNNGRLTLRPSAKWLGQAKYPVILDPTIIASPLIFLGGRGGPTATGGTITYTDSNGLNPRSSPAYAGGYTVHTFAGIGTSTITFTTSGDVDVLLVAGGAGGGGGSFSGGGGAGGMVEQAGHYITSGTYSVFVGAGGAGGANNVDGLSGNNSVFDTITANGGGGGATYNNNSPGHVGVNGGSGGGGSAGNRAGGSATQGNSGGATGYGYDGGQGSTGNGGGGGGAGGIGQRIGAAGGVGRYNSISGANTLYAVGGNGSFEAPGSFGAINTGTGGDGGGANASGSDGGSGIVILRYKPPVYRGPIIFRAGSITSQTFSYTGGQQTFTVPAGITLVTVDAKGAEGGMGCAYIAGTYHCSNSAGGKGGRVQKTLTTTPGETLYIYVGGKGENGIDGTGGNGGYNGGGKGGNGTGVGGGGGGASDVRQGSAAIGSLVVVAGAGGGGSGSYHTSGVGGGYGGNPGFVGGGTVGNGSAGGGGGATQSAVGAGGGAGAVAGSSGSAGIAEVGGAGAASANGNGGGGGGGYYGGGGGGSSSGGDYNDSGGGGGGGSSWASGGANYTSDYQTGNGEIILSWRLPTAPVIFK